MARRTVKVGSRSIARSSTRIVADDEIHLLRKESRYEWWYRVYPDIETMMEERMIDHPSPL